MHNQLIGMTFEVLAIPACCYHHYRIREVDRLGETIALPDIADKYRAVMNCQTSESDQYARSFLRLMVSIHFVALLAPILKSNYI